MPSPLENLCGPGKPLRQEAPDAKEVGSALPHTLGVGPEVWRVLDRGHTIRNRGEYDGDFYADERLVADMIKACKVIAAALRKLLPPL